MTVTTFPAFIRLAYQPDSSIKSALLADVDAMVSPAETRFEQFSNETRRLLDQALKLPRTDLGALNLGVDQQRAAAAAQEARAAAARELATATRTAAAAAGDYSQQARLAVAAGEALAKDEERAALAARAQTAAVEQLQAELNRQASASDAATAATIRNAAANDNAAKVTGSQRLGLQQLSYQIGDIATMWSLGSKPAQIFASQVGQVTQAVQLMAGGTSGVAAFMGGPWGIALSTAAIVMAPLIGNLFETGDAAEDTKKRVLDLSGGLAALENNALAAQDALQSLRDSMADASTFAEAADASTKTLITGMGEVARINREIASGEKLRDSLARTPGGVNALEVQTNRLRGLYADRAKAEAAVSKARQDLAEIASNSRAADLQKAAQDRLRDANKPERKRRGDTGASKAREAERLANFAGTAAERIARINEQFDEQPKLIDQAAQATRELDRLIADLGERKPSGFETMITDAQRAKAVIADALQRPVREFEEAAKLRVQLAQMTAGGRDAEIIALQEIANEERTVGKLTAARKAEVLAIAEAEQAAMEKLSAQRALLDNYLSAAGGIRSELEGIFAGTGSLSNIGKIYKQLQSKVIFERLFGDAFRELDKSLKAKSGIAGSVDMLASETERAGMAAGNLADSLDGAAARIAGAPGSSSGFNSAFAPWAANDNPASGRNLQLAIDGLGRSAAPGFGGQAAGANDPIEVIANLLSPQRFGKETGRVMGTAIGDVLNDLFRTTYFDKLKGAFGGAIEGAITTGTGFGAALGALKELPGLSQKLSGKLGEAFKGAQTGAMVAGLGNMLGLGMSNTGAQIGGAIGSMLPIPGGQIIGSIAGGLIGNLFHKAKYGNAVFNGGNSYAVSANSGDGKSIGSSAGDAVSSALSQLADALGATLGSFAVSIGQTDGKWRISSTGRTGELKSKYGDVTVFGKGDAAYADAVRAAIADAIRDGAIQGVRAGTQALLRAAGDLDKQIGKAVDFESVFARLKAYTDPVGAALDPLDKEFGRLKSIFQEAGASTAEFADLEKLYGLERAKAVKQAVDSIAGSLKTLLDDLNMGDNGLSLRDRRTAAMEQYAPLAARVRAGDVSAYDDYSQAARNLLDLQRAIYGSQTEYFDLFNQVRSEGRAALDQVQSVADASAGRDSPFSNSPVAAASDNASVVSAIDAQTDALLEGLGPRLDTLNSNLIAGMQGLAANGNSSGDPNLFAYSSRNYF